GKCGGHHDGCNCGGHHDDWNNAPNCHWNDECSHWARDWRVGCGWDGGTQDWRNGWGRGWGPYYGDGSGCGRSKCGGGC
nr:hypothetical protein [bacterium]